jgi:CheY-like chemotaxis protein
MKGNKILLVDDEPDVITTFKLTLESAGFIVDAYQNPLLALSTFTPSNYNMAILDIKMPQMNGFELSNKIEQIDNKTKVCFISAYNVEDKALKEKYPTLQIKCFLPKPIAVSDLLKRLEIELLR